MKTHTSTFKDEIKTYGRELDDIITYGVNTLTSEDINSVSIINKTSLMRTAMKQLTIDSNVLIPKGTIVNYQLGLKVSDNVVLDYRDNYEYLDYGNYTVEEIEEQKDTNSYLITCYDKMILTMVDYESLKEYQYILTEDEVFIENKTYFEFVYNEYEEYEGDRSGDPSALGLFEYADVTFPLTVRDYIKKICDTLGITFANETDTFINYDNVIQSELYLDNEGRTLGYTYRDVLDELAQVTGSFIIINDDDELEIRYINDTEDTIDEEYFKDTNVNIGEKYGPINSLVFSRSADSDSIARTDPISIAANGLCEIKISDNQILNDNNRDDYIDNLFNYLDGIYYYLNDFDTTGILYYEVGDQYNVSIGEDTYQCLLLNNEINRTQGITESIYTEAPDVTETDYKAVSDTDKTVNKAYLIVNKQEGRIESLVSKVDDVSKKEGNDYQEIIDKFNGYIPTESLTTLENRVSTIETDTYTRTDIQSILKGTFYDENSNQIVSEIVKTTSGTFDENGMTYEKTNAQTKTRINEVGVGVSKTDGTDEYVLFAGYVDDNNSQYSDFKGQTIVASENMLVKHYFVVGNNSRMEDYENGTGMFYIGG